MGSWVIAGQDVVLGTRDAGAAEKGSATLELNAVLQGSSPLHFEVACPTLTPPEPYAKHPTPCTPNP